MLLCPGLGLLLKILQSVLILRAPPLDEGDLPHNGRLVVLQGLLHQSLDHRVQFLLILAVPFNPLEQQLPFLDVLLVGTPGVAMSGFTLMLREAHDAEELPADAAVVEHLRGGMRGTRRVLRSSVSAC